MILIHQQPGLYFVTLAVEIYDGKIVVWLYIIKLVLKKMGEGIGRVEREL